MLTDQTEDEGVGTRGGAMEGVTDEGVRGKAGALGEEEVGVEENSGGIEGEMGEAEEKRGIGR